MSQENVADHLKRIRSDYCKGSLRDTINQFAPRSVGPCVTFIKVPEPLKIESNAVPDEIANALQERMQYTLDRLVHAVEQEHGRAFYHNPFYAQ